MALTKETVIGGIQILENGVIQVRRVLRVRDDDGTIIGEHYHHVVFPPSLDLTTVPNPRVRAHAEIKWTVEVVEAYEASLLVGI